MQTAGLASGTSLNGVGPAQITANGTATLARLTQRVAPTTQRLYDSLDPADLATAHRVLADVIERADDIRRTL
jgi:hypothetical protein